jgi:hypothetical protein
MGPAQFPVRNAFIWTKATGTFLLQDRLNELGADTSDFSWLAYATGITADGKTIIGFTPGEGSFVATLPGEADEGALLRAGTGSFVEGDGAPLRLPAVPKSPRRPRPVIKAVDQLGSAQKVGSVEFGSN